jgi:hypothetical protein
MLRTVPLPRYAGEAVQITGIAVDTLSRFGGGGGAEGDGGGLAVED